MEQLDGSTHLLELVAYLSEVSGQILGAFNFFPVFLLFGFLTYVASLWRRFVEMGTYVQGKIHKTAILAGGAVVDPACEKTKARMWKLYRYLNVAHLLCYYNIAPHLHKSLELDGLVGLGLLTHSELRLLLPHKNKMRDTMCGWSMALLQEGVRKGQLGPPEVGPPLLEACADFRGHGLGTRPLRLRAAEPMVEHHHLRGRPQCGAPRHLPPFSPLRAVHALAFPLGDRHRRLHRRPRLLGVDHDHAHPRQPLQRQGRPRHDLRRRLDHQL